MIENIPNKPAERWGKPQQLLLALVCLSALALAGCKAKDSGNAIIINDANGQNYNPVISAEQFLSTVDNPYFNLSPGRAWVYEGVNDEGKKIKIEVSVEPEPKTILGIAVTVVRDVVYEDGEKVEDTKDWYAQDKEGNVWYLGEDSKEFENGVAVNTHGSWEAGKEGAKGIKAKPGIIMLANPQVGYAYRQEYLPGEAEDMAQILRVNQEVRIGLGSYKNCITTKDWTPLEPEVVEQKDYCQEVGFTTQENKVAGGKGHIELTKMTP